MKELYSHEIPKWIRALGVWRINKDSIDAKWGCFAPRFGFELKLHRGGYFDQHIAISFCLIWGWFYIKLPFKTKLSEGCNLPDYGISIFGNCLWIHIGGKYDEKMGQCTGNDQSIVWELPYFFPIFRLHEVQQEDGTWVPYIAEWDNANKGKSDNRYIETYPFDYTLRDGQIQKRVATVYKERRTWTKKWFPFLKEIHTCLNVHFDKEVGRRSGTWKGGIIGTSIEMLPNETMLDALRRLQKEEM